MLESKVDRRWREVAAVLWRNVRLMTRILDGAALVPGELQKLAHVCRTVEHLLEDTRPDEVWAHQSVHHAYVALGWLLPLNQVPSQL